MAATHPAAAEHLPPFIIGPGETDVLFNVMLVFLLVTLVGVGILYFKLHALPEHIAHRGQKTQFQIVAVLALLALFTHNHIFWVAGLLQALVQFPDFSTPIGRIADSLESIAGRAPSARDSALAPAETLPAATTPAPSSEQQAG
jgi:hypothetical protein